MEHFVDVQKVFILVNSVMMWGPFCFWLMSSHEYFICSLLEVRVMHSVVLITTASLSVRQRLAAP